MLTIIGSGMAAYTVAREFRKVDKTAPLMIITADDGGFYSKPMLSNAFAQGKHAGNLISQSATAMAEQLSATILTNTIVSKVDTLNKKVITPAVDFSYTQLVIAVGAQAIRLPMNGDAAASVLSVNHIQDYAVFREKIDAIGPQARVAIIGAGLIGCEFADDLSTGGHIVSLIDPNTRPLAALAPIAISEGLQQALQARGVQLHLGTAAASIDYKDKALHITLTNGIQIDADVVLSAVGLRPDTRIAAAARLQIDRGILINHYGQTSAADVYAIGDCAQYSITGEALTRTLPYIAPIMVAARALAKTLSGTPSIIDLKPAPVIVKTPSYPIALIAPAPHQSASATWKTEQVGNATVCRCFDDKEQQIGFALAPQEAKLRASLIAELAT